MHMFMKKMKMENVTKQVLVYILSGNNSKENQHRVITQNLSDDVFPN